MTTHLLGFQSDTRGTRYMRQDEPGEGEKSAAPKWDCEGDCARRGTDICRECGRKEKP